MPPPEISSDWYIVVSSQDKYCVDCSKELVGSERYVDTECGMASAVLGVPKLVNSDTSATTLIAGTTLESVSHTSMLYVTNHKCDSG